MRWKRLDNAQTEYSATLSPAPYFFLIRWEQLFGSGAQANKFSLVLSFVKRKMTVEFKTREILLKKWLIFISKIVVINYLFLIFPKLIFQAHSWDSNLQSLPWKKFLHYEVSHFWIFETKYAIVILWSHLKTNSRQ